MESNNIFLIKYTSVSRKSAFIVRFCLKASKEGYEVSERFMPILLNHVHEKKNDFPIFNSKKIKIKIIIIITYTLADIHTCLSPPDIILK